MKRIVVPIIMLVAVGMATSAWASMYTGSITNGDGLYGTFDWGVAQACHGASTTPPILGIGLTITRLR